MKRIIVLSAVFLVLSSAVFAVSSVKGNTVDEVSKTSPQQTVSLSLKPESVGSFEFGFSTKSGTQKHSEDSLAATALALSADDKTIADNSGSPLYIWWNITTSETFYVKLGMSGALTYNTTNLIDWTVTRDNKDTTTLKDVNNIDLSSVTEEDKTSCTFISHTNSGDNTIVNYTGEQKLYISTVAEGDNTLVGKATGDNVSYTATLTLSISST